MAVGLRTCRTWTPRTNVWPTIGTRPYAAVAIKTKQKPSSSQTPGPPTSSRTPKVDPQPSDGKANKSKSRPSSIESAAEQDLKALQSMKRFNKMYATADVWGTEMASLGMTTVFNLAVMPQFDFFIRCGDTL